MIKYPHLTIVPIIGGPHVAMREDCCGAVAAAQQSGGKEKPCDISATGCRCYVR